MGLSGSRNSDRRRESAVCAVCLSPVFDVGLPALDCQHKLCVKCLTRFSGKTVLKGEKYPRPSQCPICSELILFPDSSTKLSNDESPPAFHVSDEESAPVTSYKEQSARSADKQSSTSPSRKRQRHDEKEESDDDEFQDAHGEGSARTIKATDYIDCVMCKNHKPKRKKTQGSVYCFDCTMALCEVCRENHDLRPRCHGHILCPVTPESIKDLLCDAHGQLAEDYCIDCQCVTCAECHVSDHRGHTITAFTVQNLDETIFAEMKECKLKNQKLLDLVESKENIFSSELQSTREVVKKHHQEIIKAVNMHFNSLTSKLDDEESSAKESFEEVRRSIMEDNSVLSDLLEKGHHLVSPIASIQDLHIAHGSDLLEDLKMKIPHTKYAIQQPDTYVYIPVEEVKTNYGQLIKVPADESERCIEVD